jgi:hypothetical protein
VSALGDRAKALIARLPSRRRRAAVAGGAAIAAAAVLLAVIPPGSAGERPAAATESPAPESSSATRDEARDLPEMGDDPALAAVALLERREECFRELSILCLDGVDQLDSVALAADHAVIVELRAGREAAPSTVEPIDPRVVERLGDSALVDIGPETSPASLLIMRSEAGWRIRDWVAGD